MRVSPYLRNSENEMMRYSTQEKESDRNQKFNVQINSWAQFQRCSKRNWRVTLKIWVGTETLWYDSALGTFLKSHLTQRSLHGKGLFCCTIIWPRPFEATLVIISITFFICTSLLDQCENIRSSQHFLMPMDQNKHCINLITASDPEKINTFQEFNPKFCIVAKMDHLQCKQIMVSNAVYVSVRLLLMFILGFNQESGRGVWVEEPN